jgi:hypothetical protein
MRERERERERERVFVLCLDQNETYGIFRPRYIRNMEVVMRCELLSSVGVKESR